MPTDSQNLPSQIRQILLTAWDPHDVSCRLPEAFHTYDTYIPAILDLLQSNPHEEALIDYFYARERESMCFPGLGKARLRPLARKLLALHANITKP